MDPDPSSFSFLLDILKPFEPLSLVPLAILIILLFASAMVSGSEVAFFSIQQRDLDDLKDVDKGGHEALSNLLEGPKTLLATILIWNNFINVGIVILSSYLSVAFFDFGDSPSYMKIVVEVVAITFLILLFGEVLPKVYATKNAVNFGLTMSKPMFALRRLSKPLSFLLVRSSSFIERRLQHKSENLSVDDLSQALELTSNEESSDEEQKILAGIVKFGSTNVTQIMKPRIDVVAVDHSWEYGKIMDGILESGYSRIPVFEDNFDNIKGVLYVKDLLPHIEASSNFAWQELVREPFFVPENKKIDDLLREFQERKIHLAIVVDEYGGTSGVVTLEDIIEEIVGEISDEFDNDELYYSKLDEKNYVFEAKIHLTDFYKVVNAEESDFAEQAAEADTLAGFLLEVAGKFPEVNEEIAFKNYLFKVESLEGRRIKRIKVTLLNEEA